MMKMYRMVYYKKIGNKVYGPYQCLRISMGYGRQKTLSLRTGASVMDCLLSNPFRTDEFFKIRDDWLKQRQSRAAKTPTTSLCGKKRKRAFNKPILELLKSAGFSVQGRRVSRNNKKYFTQESALIRFSILSDEDRVMVGSPQGLLELELKALKLLKILAARGQKGCSYEKSLATTIYSRTEA